MPLPVQRSSPPRPFAGDELLGTAMNRVVRRGQTVRRPIRPGTLAIHALLKHLERKGFGAAPHALGIEQGQEVLSFIPGEAAHYPLPPFVLSKATVAAVAKLLRRYHDATENFELPGDTRWLQQPPGPPEVICHGDLGPYNVIFRDRMPVGFIDFDHASPGPRLWDVAYAVYRFTPLCGLSAAPVTSGTLRAIARGIRVFSDAYGLQEVDRLVQTVVTRLYRQAEWLHAPNPVDREACRRLVVDGHACFYEREAHCLARHQERLRYLLQVSSQE